MNQEKKQNKADEIIKRIFKEIAKSHFNDRKMIPHYCNSVHFPRSLGDDIADWVQAYYPEYYHNKRDRALLDSKFLGLGKKVESQ